MCTSFINSLALNFSDWTASRKLFLYINSPVCVWGIIYFIIFKYLYYLFKIIYICSFLMSYYLRVGDIFGERSIVNNTCISSFQAVFQIMGRGLFSVRYTLTILIFTTWCVWHRALTDVSIICCSLTNYPKLNGLK